MMALQSLQKRWKTSLIVSLLCAPVLLLACLFVSLSLKDIDFSNREIIGARYQRANWKILSGLYAGASDLQGRQDQAKGVADLKVLAGTYNARLGLQPDYDNLRRKLDQLDVAGRGKNDLEPAIGQMRAFMKRVSDASNLTLDTEIDTYYLMNATDNVLPNVGLHSAAILRELSAVTGSSAAGKERQAVITADISLLKLTGQNANTSVASAIQGNREGRLADSIMPRLDDFNRAQDAYVSHANALLAQIAAGRTVSSSEVDALRLDHAALTRETDHLWLTAATDLDRLLGLRVDGQRIRLLFLLLASAVVTALAIGVAVYLDLHVHQHEILKLNATLRQSNQDLERFAFICSHDLQEPVRMMNIYADLIEEAQGGDLNSDARQYLGLLRDNASRMRKMIRDVLTFSRLDAEAIKRESVDCNQVVQGLLAEFETDITSCGACVTCGELPTLETSATLVRVVLQNLISNALKFRDAGRCPQISITSRREGPTWRFEVADNGIGMDASVHHKIFSIFERLNAYEDYPGTGIGLSTCQKFIRLCGGDIGFTSQLGEGTVFSFTLPAKEPGPAKEPRVVKEALVTRGIGA